MGIFVRSEPTKHTYSVQGRRKYYFSTNCFTILHKNMKLLSLFLIPAIFAQSTKQKAADNAKENAENYACFSCGYNSLNQAGDESQCQNPVQGQTKQVSCPKDKYCFTVNTVTTPRNASNKIPQKTDILRGCYNINKKPANYEDATFTPGQSVCRSYTETKSDGQTVQSDVSQCTEVCQGMGCNTGTPTDSSGLSTGAVVGIVVGVVVALLLIIGLVVYFMKYRGHNKVPTEETNELH